MSNPLSVHWIPAHRGSIAGRSDRDWFALWDPSFVKIVVDDETIPYVEDVPPAAKIIVRNYPLSELGHSRGFATTRSATLLGQEPQTGSGRDQLVDGPGAFAFATLLMRRERAMRGPSDEPEDVGDRHAQTCHRIALWAEGRGIPRTRLLFEGLNEPMLWSVEPPAQVARYYRSFLLRLHDFNLRGVVGNFGVGWPGNGGVQDQPVQWDFFKPVIDVMDLAPQRPDYIGLHEYWSLHGVGQNWKWWAGRYEQCPFRVPILITETGIDTGVSGTYYGGWANLPGEMTERAARYVGELAWYWQRCRADGRIQAIFPFTYDRGHDTWTHFDIRNEDWLREFTSRLAEFPAPASLQPEPKPEDPKPEPVDVQSILRTAAWNQLYPSGGVRYNPDAAFQRGGRQAGAGCPTTNEFDVQIVNGPCYRVQGFSKMILYAKVGDWGNILALMW